MSQNQNLLWSVEEAVAATGGTLDGDELAGLITGISIDTRTLEKNDLFVALQDVRDGHDFVSAAFAKGAAMALVSHDYQKTKADGLLLRVAEPLEGLRKMAAAARARLGQQARVIAVTGSAGKTTTKEMLRICFAALGKVHASEKSYNNHWGVPLTLARMPKDTDFAVIEIGMNHAGEIKPLSELSRPHVALITSVLPVHLEHFSGIEAIAAAKAEIFAGLCQSGWAIIPRDASQYVFLAQQAAAVVGASFEEVMEHRAKRVVSFGEHPDSFTIVDNIKLELTKSRAVLRSAHAGFDDSIGFEVGLPGRHNVLNASACLSAWSCATAGLDIALNAEQSRPGLEGALRALAHMSMEPVGRGQVFELANEKTGAVTLIDESYNANPASMRAAFENLSLYPTDRRKVAVIGDMLELGTGSPDLHAALVGPLQEAGIDIVFACGAHMKTMYDQLPAQMRGAYALDAQELKPILLGALHARDIVMVKGSNGSKLGSVVEALKTNFSL